jgi:glycosyltransferase involved in cell wall biosynthesis
MRILMISDFYPPFLGGVEVVVAGLSRELAARGHAVAVASLAHARAPRADSGPVAGNGDDGRVRVYPVRTSAQRAGGLFATSDRRWAPPAPDPEAVAGLRAVVRRERPDVVHGHDWLARSYLPLKRHGRGPAFVMSLHYYTLSCPKKNLMYRGAPCTGPALAKCLGCAGWHYGRAKGAAVVLGQRIFSRVEASRVDLFLPVSRAAAEGNGLPSAGLPYEVVPNLLSTQPAPEEHGSLLHQLPAEPFFLFVGDIRRDKGVDVLLEAYQTLHEPPPLVLIGETWGDTPDDFPRGARVLRDWPNAAVRAAMGRCLALVVPSLWREPFGMVVAEALAAGRPVVGSAIGGIPEIVRDGREGLLVPPGDAPALSRALERIARDPGQREALARDASDRAARFRPETVVPRVEAAYERAMRDARRGRSGRSGTPPPR